LGSLSKITLNLNGTNHPWNFSYTADANRNIQSTTITDGLGTTRLVAFNAGGFVTSDTVGANQTGGLHQQTTYTRDAATNFVTDQYDPIRLNADGTTATGANGSPRHSVFSWDFATGTLRSVTKASGTAIAATTSYTYDPLNCYFVQTAKDPDGNAGASGHTVTNTYSGDGRCNLSGTQDGNGNTTIFASYNAQGQLLQKTSPMQETATYTYDTFGDLTSATDPLGHQTTTAYDSAGRVSSVTDALGDTTSYCHDSSGRVTVKTLPILCGFTGNCEITYSYDVVGNLTGLTDPDAQRWSWTYDTLNHVSHATDPNTHQVGYQYDANGNLTDILRRDRQRPDNLHQ
jgi:YD repeat-containing protein